MDQPEERMPFPCSQLPPAMRGKDRARQWRRTRRRKEKGGEGEEAKKRRLSDAQVKLLETSFLDERKLGAGRKARLAADLGLDPKQVAVWFQNRRARHKSKQVEDAFAVLKMAHDAVVLEKCHLEHQILELKKKISEVEEETKRLTSGGMDGGSSGSNVGGEGGGGSPSSSFSAVSQQAFFEQSELLYTPEYSFNDYLMDWANFYGVWIN